MRPTVYIAIATCAILLVFTPADADERHVDIVATLGYASLKKCTSYALFHICKSRTVDIPLEIEYGTMILIRGSDTGELIEFPVSALRADPERSLCWLQASLQREALVFIPSHTITVKPCLVLK